jgi:hypothetical protein
MYGALFLLLTLIVVAGGFLARHRVRRTVRDRSTLAGDELLRSILGEEELRALDEDEPLDEDAIREAEDEFWAEDEWTDADDWRD